MDDAKQHKNTKDDEKIQSLNTKLDDLLDETKKIVKGIDETNNETRKRIDSINVKVDKTIKNIERIFSELDEIEKESGDELDKLILEQAEELESE